jgi:hypothetical protein
MTERSLLQASTHEFIYHALFIRIKINKQDDKRYFSHLPDIDVCIVM